MHPRNIKGGVKTIVLVNAAIADSVCYLYDIAYALNVELITTVLP